MKDIDIWRRRERGETIAEALSEKERDKERERLSEDTLRVPPGRPKYVHALLG